MQSSRFASSDSRDEPASDGGRARGVTATEHELARVEAEIKKLIQSIKDGVSGAVLKDEAIRREAQRTELRARLERAAEPPPLLHSNMADLRRSRNLRTACSTYGRFTRPMKIWWTRREPVGTRSSRGCTSSRNSNRPGEHGQRAAESARGVTSRDSLWSRPDARS